MNGNINNINNNGNGNNTLKAEVADTAKEMVPDDDNNVVTANNNRNTIGSPKGVSTAKGKQLTREELTQRVQRVSTKVM